jgi:hypothetical protein
LLPSRRFIELLNQKFGMPLLPSRRFIELLNQKFGMPLLPSRRFIELLNQKFDMPLLPSRRFLSLRRRLNNNRGPRRVVKSMRLQKVSLLPRLTDKLASERGRRDFCE